MTVEEIAAALVLARTSLSMIQGAMAKGELSVTFSDRSVMYRTMSDLIKAQSWWVAEIARLEGLSAGTRPRNRQTLGTSVDGWN